MSRTAMLLLAFALVSASAHADSVDTMQLAWTPPAGYAETSAGRLPVYLRDEGLLVQATSNGTAPEYRYQLFRKQQGAEVLVDASLWSTDASLSIQPLADGLPAGKYRIAVQVRDAGARREPLTKFAVFMLEDAQ